MLLLFFFFKIFFVTLLNIRIRNWLSLNSINMNIAVDTGRHKFECAEIHYPLIYKLRRIIYNSKYDVKKNKYDQNFNIYIKEK